MKNKIIKILILILSIQLPQISNASHLQGGEVTYKWLGKKKYEITGKLYRDCNGISLNSPTFTVQAQGINAINIPYTRVSIEEMNFRCKDSVRKLCNPPNSFSSTFYSSEIHTFVGYVDFEDSVFKVFPDNNKCEIFFSISQCCRNGMITTINPGVFYVESMLNICKTQYKNSSPQFDSKNVLKTYCNVALTQNYGAKDFEDFDSFSYELATPMNGFNSNETYVGNFSNLLPVTPYCPPNPGVLNCTPRTTLNPPRGFFFNKQSGDVIFTPTKCDEVSVITVKTNEYRKDSSGQWQLIGFVSRDIQLIVVSNNPNNIIPKFKANYFINYKFKTRKESCIDFETYDTIQTYSSSGNLGNETELKLLKLPPGATFKYVDSTQRLKTGRFCWTVPDSIYNKLTTKSKMIPITIELKDNFCDIPYVLQKSFSITVLPPDSVANLNIQTFLDKNNDSVKNQNEKGFATSIQIKDKHTSKYISTNDSGFYNNKVWVGNFQIGIMKHPYIQTTTKDTSIEILFDSSYYLNFGANLNSGIYGRIYNDTNGNCKYDNGEPTFSGVKVFTDSNQYVGISDVNGLYFIDAPAGSYNLSCEYNSKSLKVNCPLNNQISLTTIVDSAHLNNDFGISKNPDFTDIGVFPKVSRLTRGGYAQLSIVCKNLGHKKMKNITTTVAVINNLLLIDDKNTNQQSFNILIDSLDVNETKMIKFSCLINQNLVVAGDKVCFEVYTDQTTLNRDSIKTNNYEKICGIVNAPYDPNNKLVLGDSIKTTLDQLVTYNVQFQNTGTDTAIRVIVTDTIDTRHLSLKDFKLNWSDYPCDVVFEGKVIHFIFNNINLPYFSKSYEKSIGSFCFTLGIVPNTKIEKEVSNKVSIFFDFEDPVITEPSIFQIKSPVSISKIMKPQNCINQNNRVYIKSNIKLKAGNIYTVQLKDSSNNLINIGNKASISTNDSININVPMLFKSGKYSIRILSSNPQSVSIPQSGIDSLMIYSKPQFNIQTNLNQNSICENDSIKFTCNNNVLQYKFVANNNFSSVFSLINNYAKLVKINDKFIVIGKDGLSCSDTQKITPIVNSIPNTVLKVINIKAQYCSGDSVVFNFQGGNRFELFQNNSIIYSSTASSFKHFGTINSVYQLKSYNNFDCYNLSDTVPLVFNPLPIAQISAQKNPLCSYDSTKLILSNDYRRNIYKNNYIFAIDYNHSYLDVSKIKNGDKFIMLSTTNKNCSKFSNEIVFNLFPNSPKPIIKTSDNNLSIGDFLGNLQWYKENVLQQESDSILKNAQTGTYYVILTDTNGCMVKSDDFNHTNVSLSLLSKYSIKIYPNPANEFLTIENSNKEVLNVLIMSVSGQNLINKTIEDQIEMVNLLNIPSGIYILKIRFKNGEEVHYKFNILK
ncbi:MAG: T9SS type A sorting domain-containing protein [Bacteroidota bacterium]|nr:T9SS type A sorting domain-containing protein [Bacteroidota bacterium]